MKERPILFNGEMVRAILDGRKTQTRRVAKWPPKIRLLRKVRGEIPFPLESDIAVADPGVYQSRSNPHGALSVRAKNGNWLGVKPGEFEYVSPFGQPGDRLWVRETVAFEESVEPHQPFPYDDGRPVYWFDSPDETRWSFPHYRATDPNPALDYDDGKGPRVKWTPSIFMPRWASRIDLEVTRVRVERLQEISLEDAIREGFQSPVPSHVYEMFAEYWDKLNAKRGYPGDSNPWVWVIEFTRINAPSP